MLIKKELSAVATLPFPNVERGKGWRGKHEYALAVTRVDLPRSGDIFIADLFRWIDATPVLRFCSDGDNYICSEYPLTEWGKFNPDKRFDICSIDEDPSAYDATKLFLFGKSYSYHSTAIGLICEWIRRQNENARYNAYLRKDALMRSHFAMYPELPADLEDFCDTQVFDRWYLFFSKIQKHGKRDAFCTHCGKRFRISKESKHNNEGICPKCGTSVTYKAAWINGTYTDSDKICIASNVDDQLLLRWVKISRSYGYPNFKRNYEFESYAYNLYLKKGKIYFYKWTSAPYTYGLTWYRGKLGEQGHDRTHIYTNNLADVFGRSYYNVDLQKGLQGKHSVVSFCALLNSLKNIPAAEYLFKLGLPQLASELDVFRYVPDDARFEDLYGLSRDYIPLLRKVNANYNEVKLIRAAGRYVPEETILQYRSLALEPWCTDGLIDATKDASFQRIINYLAKQKSVVKKRGPGVFQLWRDYIRMCKNLDVDLSHKSVLFPKNIQESHDMILPRFKEIRAEVECREKMKKAEKTKAAYQQAIKDLYCLLPPMPYSRNDLMIALPQEPADLVREGHSLDHCVGDGGYEGCTIRKTSMIIFIRKASAPDVPYFTMEYGIHERRIRQLYGYKNRVAPPEVRSFAESFVKRIKVLVENRGEKSA